MTAHDVDDAARRLGELKAQSIEDSVLAAVAFGLALAAAQYQRSLAMPLALGAIAMAFLAGRAFVKRFLLVDELAADHDAYRIPAVRDFGVRAASIEHRRQLAGTVRAVLLGPTGDVGDRLAAARPELEALICALEAESTCWEPQAVVALDHWLSDPGGSFRDVTVSAAELRSRLRNVLASVESASTR